jgi:hypothetical protein
MPNERVLVVVDAFQRHRRACVLGDIDDHERVFRPRAFEHDADVAAHRRASTVGTDDVSGAVLGARRAKKHCVITRRVDRLDRRRPDEFDLGPLAGGEQQELHLRLRKIRRVWQDREVGRWIRPLVDEVAAVEGLLGRPDDALACDFPTESGADRFEVLERLSMDEDRPAPGTGSVGRLGFEHFHRHVQRAQGQRRRHADGAGSDDDGVVRHPQII